MVHEAGSGNRWEPRPAPARAAGESADVLPAPAEDLSRSRVRRDKGLLPGLAGGLLLGGAAGGYALGHVVVVRADESGPGQHQGGTP